MRCLLGLLAIPLFALPAAASTVPRVDFKPGETSIAGGMLDFNLDHAFTERLAAGLTYCNFAGNVAGLRATYRLDGQPAGDGNGWGVTIAAGTAPFIQYSDPYAAQTVGQLFVQPALVWSSSWGILRTRATLGPVWEGRVRADGSTRYLDSQLIPIWPNVEVALHFPWGEITAGGNAVVGARLII